jgi:peptide/nickel transport system permease protein
MIRGAYMKSLQIQAIFSFMLSIIGIIFIGSLPFVFVKMNIDLNMYVKGTTDLFIQLLNPANIVYFTDSGVPRNLFPDMWEPYLYSLKVLLTAFLTAILCSICLSLLISNLSIPKKRFVRKLLFIFESVPDILVAVVIQMFVIWFFKTFNVLLFPIGTAYEQKVYLLPIICLTILPMLLCTRILLYDIELEKDKPYIETVLGKGLSAFYILWRHILPNAILSFFYHTKNIWWFMLSNLLVIEYLFNIYGMTTFMLDNSSPEIFTIGMLLLFIPMYLFFALAHTFIFRIRGGEDV